MSNVISITGQSFTEMVTNQDRHRAELVLEAFVAGMKSEGIDRATIVRTLFDYVIHELGDTPQGGELPSPTEEVENRAIFNEIDAYWMGLRKQLEEAVPGYFVDQP